MFEERVRLLADLPEELLVELQVRARRQQVQQAEQGRRTHLQEEGEVLLVRGGPPGIPLEAPEDVASLLLEVEAIEVREVEGGPQELGGLLIDPGETLAFRENQTGEVTYGFVPLQNTAFEKLAWYERTEVQIVVLATMLAMNITPMTRTIPKSKSLVITWQQAPIEAASTTSWKGVRGRPSSLVGLGESSQVSPTKWSALSTWPQALPH